MGDAKKTREVIKHNKIYALLGLIAPKPFPENFNWDRSQFPHYDLVSSPG